MKIKQYCRYKGIMCSRATEFGYCNLTACINRGVNHEAQVTLDDISTAYENGYRQGKFETLQWIPCSERKPKQQQPVIITDEGDVLTGYINSLNEWMDFHGNRLKGVIAWMPLPEPYKENES